MGTLKIYFSLSLFLFFSHQLLYSQTQFQKIYLEIPSFQVRMNQAQNGDFFMVADVFPTTNPGGHKILIQRLDQNSNILDYTALRTGGVTYNFTHSAATNDGGLVVSGTTNPVATNQYSVYLVKLNDSLDVLWSKSFEFDSELHDVKGITELNDGSVIVFGNFRNSITFITNLFLVKFSPTGTLSWSKEIRSQVNGANSTIGGVTETNTGDLWVFGANILTTGYSWNMKLNSTGVFQSATSYPTHNLTGMQPSPLIMYERNNGDRDLFYNRTSQDSSILVMVRTNSSGTPIQTNVYSQQTTFAGNTIGVYPNGTGGYLLSGQMAQETTFPYREDGYVINMDGNGTPSWSKKYNTNNFEHLIETIPTNDGGLLMIGNSGVDSINYNPSENGLPPWLVKTNAAGDASCTTNFIVTQTSTTITSNSIQLDVVNGPSATNITWNSFNDLYVADTLICTPVVGVKEHIMEDVKIYPNPTTGLVNLEFGNLSSIKKITISNILGHVLFEKQIRNNQLNSILLPDENGLYFLTVYSKDGGFKTFKIVKK